VCACGGKRGCGRRCRSGFEGVDVGACVRVGVGGKVVEMCYVERGGGGLGSNGTARGVSVGSCWGVVGGVCEG
jgi:hypothetical protein